MPCAPCRLTLPRALLGAVALSLILPAAALACRLPEGHAAIRSEMLAQVNAERARAGLPRLVPSPRLQAVAEAHACDSARHDRMSHRGSDGSTLRTRLQRAGYAFRTANENVAMGYRSASRAVGMWMTSPGHRKNILSRDTRQVGVAVAISGNGRPHWVMVSGASRG